MNVNKDQKCVLICNNTLNVHTTTVNISDLIAAPNLRIVYNWFRVVQS